MVFAEDLLPRHTLQRTEIDFKNSLLCFFSQLTFNENNKTILIFFLFSRYLEAAISKFNHLNL